MKINCGPTKEEKDAKLDADWVEEQRRLKHWHLWFAWRPIRLGSRDCRWLEWIERKGSFTRSWGDCSWTFEYRPTR